MTLTKKPEEPSPSRMSWLKGVFTRKPSKPTDTISLAVKNLQQRSKQMSLDERHILGNFLQFCDKSVDDVMIPRSDICAVQSNITLQELSKVIIRGGHTRTLVYEDTLDNIIGFVHIKDLFDVIATKRAFNLKKLMRRPIVAATSMKLIDVLAEMQKCRTHIAVIVDEYGGTDGIATIEDIMEAIVGEIEDEHDDTRDDHEFQIIAPGQVLTHARVEIQELENAIGIKLKSEEEDCDTIGGLVLTRMGRMPAKGALLELSDTVTAEIVEASPRMLKKIRISY
jgi:magnesium and cobalt transporter